MLVFVDIEATSVYPTYAQVMEFYGCVYDEVKKEIIEELHVLGAPSCGYVPKAVTELTGHTYKSLKEHGTEEEMCIDISLWSKDIQQKYEITGMVGHNITRYDNKVLENRLDFFNAEWGLKDVKLIDTLSHAKGVKSRNIKCLVPDTGFRTESGKNISYKQEHIAKFFGIDYKAHSAKEDILCLIQIYENMFHPEQATIKRTRKQLGF